ncbi:pseudouridine synthase [Geomonas ferrireducens]|jgi:tRNA pseudouridine32 synthase/23S rRNA pseudouridine746 synthase|uniref:pseudouridine synthase n=1 Tax=Geomonas ferrireducens TaxID=2570227 RepID=UPI0010A8B73D|nr:pseudouridine synthase [Geomonas ferrireducens]
MISAFAAKVTMPRVEQPHRTVLAFLLQRFPKIPPEVWERRVAEGKVLSEDGTPITPETPYAPQKRVFYFREIENEQVIPFTEEILFQNEELLVACKPHFLPVTPVGAYLEQSLLHRLRRRTGIDHIVPLHRIDRETAGLVLFSVNPATRGLYGGLFRQGRIEKSYLALSEGKVPGEEWSVESRLVPGDPWYTMTVAPGEANARSRIKRIGEKGGVSLFSLVPHTGKTHQLRVHMSSLGMPIMHDRLYPQLRPRQFDDFEKPLQLLAHTLRFEDPVTGKVMEFRSNRELLW